MIPKGFFYLAFMLTLGLALTTCAEQNDFKNSKISKNKTDLESDTALDPNTNAPVLAVVTPVSTPTNDTTPVFVFSSTEEGQIKYWGSCLGSAASASAGNNSITNPKPNRKKVNKIIAEAIPR